MRSTKDEAKKELIRERSSMLMLRKYSLSQLRTIIPYSSVTARSIAFALFFGCMAADGFAQDTQSEIDNILSHFLVVKDKSGAPVFRSWSSEEISYVIVGNLSREIYEDINKKMALIGRQIDKKIYRSNSGRIFFIFDTDVFRDLTEHPQKFLSVGISQQAVDVLSNQLRNKSDAQCASFSNEDANGDTLTTLLVSVTNDEKCVNRLVYYSLGLVWSSSNENNDEYLCILYKASRRGERDKSSIQSHFAYYKSECDLDK